MATIIPGMISAPRYVPCWVDHSCGSQTQHDNTRGTDDLTPVTGESVCEKTETSLGLSCQQCQHINFIGLAL